MLSPSTVPSIMLPMGNIQKKRLSKLKLRTDAFDSLPAASRLGRRRPGSQNNHKQACGTGLGGGKKR